MLNRQLCFGLSLGCVLAALAGSSVGRDASSAVAAQTEMSCGGQNECIEIRPLECSRTGARSAVRCGFDDRAASQRHPANYHRAQRRHDDRRRLHMDRHRAGDRRKRDADVVEGWPAHRHARLQGSYLHRDECRRRDPCCEGGRPPHDAPRVRPHRCGRQAGCCALRGKSEEVAVPAGVRST